MHGIGVAEQVVHVSQDLLVGADQEEAYEVVFLLPDTVERQEFGPAGLADETGDLAVRVAGDIGDGGHDVRLLVEPLQRHDREDLVDGP